ncbi:SdpI/YhfL protein family protein [uncultured archaeon]|nr:SdpI/YhfL protein family protein [uncultured archaeon]
MRKTELFIIAVIFLSFIIGIYVYPSMPALMASHWNAQGEVNGYMPKFWGLFLLPLISVGLLLLFVAIPRIDPLKENIAKFRKYFDGFVALIILFLFYIHILSLYWNLGARFNFIAATVPALSILFYCVGILLEHTKRNWFIGIRTPWTLSSERVWDNTHAIGGKLFKIAAIIGLFGAVFERYAIWFVLAPVVFVVIYTIVYSYYEWKKK